MVRIKKPTIFVDLDGTILDVSERVYRIYKDILKEHNKKYLSKSIYLKLRRDNLPIKKILKITKAERIFSNFKKEAKGKIEKKCYLFLDKLSESRRKILLQLKKHYKLILITLRENKKILKTELKKNGIDKIFDKVLVSSAKNYRQKWEIKYKLMKNFGYNKESIIFGDTETDIIAGKKIGIKTAAVCWGMRKKEILKKYKPDFLIKNITEFKNATLRFKKTI